MPGAYRLIDPLHSIRNDCCSRVKINWTSNLSESRLRTVVGDTVPCQSKSVSHLWEYNETNECPLLFKDVLQRHWNPERICSSSMTTIYFLLLDTAILLPCVCVCVTAPLSTRVCVILWTVRSRLTIDAVLPNTKPVSGWFFLPIDGLSRFNFWTFRRSNTRVNNAEYWPKETANKFVAQFLGNKTTVSFYFVFKLRKWNNNCCPAKSVWANYSINVVSLGSKIPWW